ncbi:MAG TPA: hypothetical protein VL866_23435 [Pyrinomonadaceae bacterium]|nr:hypothetical protein [Pyrinomonadaceae bacterium]
MEHKPQEGTLTSPLARKALRLSLLSILACCFFWPALAQGQVRRLIFTIKTADDDLRGGDNLNVGIHFRDGNVQWKPNVNRGQSWGENTTQTFDIGLQQPVPLSKIVSIELQKPTSGSVFSGADEWHMASISVRAMGDGIDKVIATHGLKQFSEGYDDLVLPITIAVAGKVSKLELTIKTDGDNLEHYDGLTITIHFRGGHTQVVDNANEGRAWENDSTHVKTITLDQVVDPSEINRIVLQAGYSLPDNTIPPKSDNWNMDSIAIRAIGDGVDKVIARHGFNRFTGTHQTLSIPITAAEAGKANKLEFTILTGGDDLRGDNENLNVVIQYRDGRTQHANNINGGRNWANGSMHVETITLNRAVDPSEIVEVDLETTFDGGCCGDNWDMNSVIVKAVGDGVNEVLFTKVGFPAKRFTGDKKILRLKERSEH